MDLLGSILGNMSAPPGVSAEEKKRREKERQLEERQRKAAKEFRAKTEAKVNAFLKTEEKRLNCPPMEKHLRSIVHDVAEVAGLVGHSLGEDGVDRHVVLWKKEAAPSEDELVSTCAYATLEKG